MPLRCDIRLWSRALPHYIPIQPLPLRYPSCYIASMPNTTLTNLQTQIADITVMTSTAGGPPALDTTSSIQAFLSSGATNISISPPPAAPTTARSFTMTPLAAGPFAITVAGPNGSQDVINGSVMLVPNTSTLTITLRPPTP